jgi:hypothetical protein
VVNIEIKPAPPGSNGAISVDGKEVTISDEKASLTSLGRDELQDDRISRMALLSRYAAEFFLLLQF